MRGWWKLGLATLSIVIGCKTSRPPPDRHPIGHLEWSVRSWEDLFKLGDTLVVIGTVGPISRDPSGSIIEAVEDPRAYNPVASLRVYELFLAGFKAERVVLTSYHGCAAVVDASDLRVDSLSQFAEVRPRYLDGTGAEVSVSSSTASLIRAYYQRRPEESLVEGERVLAFVNGCVSSKVGTADSIALAARLIWKFPVRGDDTVDTSMVGGSSRRALSEVITELESLEFVRNPMPGTPIRVNPTFNRTPAP